MNGLVYVSFGFARVPCQFIEMFNSSTYSYVPTCRVVDQAGNERHILAREVYLNPEMI